MSLGTARVSTSEQGAGLLVQRSAIQAEATRREWELVATCEDAGASGKDLKRPGLQEALALVESGAAEILCVSKLDRLSRSVHDFSGLLQRAQRKGWSLSVLDLQLDTSTPSGALVANVMASVSEWERRVIGSRTRDALQVKKAQGVRLGRPPTMAPEAIRLIHELRAEGRSYRAIAATLNERQIPTAQGGREWHAQTVRLVALRSAA